MKDQYVGDVNDYVKYALLRTLSASHPGTLQVCWMRTAPDMRTDGRRLGYLNDPARFRALDPVVFDSMSRILAAGRRRVAAVERSGILTGARFHAALLDGDERGRGRYFDRLRSHVGPNDLVFFDPDNGLEVASVPAGRRGCCKYLRWSELEATVALGCSALIYQHFPRVPREPYVTRMLDGLAARLPEHGAFALWTPSVAYLLCAPPQRIPRLRRACLSLAARLPGHVALSATRGPRTARHSPKRSARVNAANT